MPDGLTSERAAAVLPQGMTAHLTTHDVHEGRPGERALVHAAAGGTGSLLVQILLAQGATVIATTSSAPKSDYLRALGVAHVVDSRGPDVAGAVRAIVPGGVDVVFDSVGAATFETSLRAIRPMGTIVVFGQSSGPVPPTDIPRLSGLTGEGLPGSLWLTWPTLSDYNATPGALARRADAVFAAVLDGTLTPAIAATFPLREAARAHTLLEWRGVTGKILLEVAP